MCLAIYKPKGASVPRKHLEAGFKSNKDGAGFAVAKNGELIVRKGFFTFTELWQAWQPFQFDAAIIHFRWATHGEVGEANCHPFSLNGGKYALIHNGIIDIESEGGMSDTGTFAHLVLEPLLDRLSPDEPSLVFLVESFLGAGNKVVILDAAGLATIYNESAGLWLNGVWYSNNSFEPKPAFVSLGRRTIEEVDDDKWFADYCGTNWKRNDREWEGLLE